MKNLFLLLALWPFLGFAQSLTNGTNIPMIKTWSQEPNGHSYPIFIHVPNTAVPEGGFPVCILLHGNGGNGAPMIGQFRDKLDCYVLVAPSGYANTWNISDESSEAPDVEMIGHLIDSLQNYSNINPNKIRIFGSSNGAALANRVFIENKNPGLDMVCAAVSQLSEAQYRNGSFYYPDGATGGTDPYDGYNVATTPITGRKYLSICNINDPIIPYNGGAAVGVNFIPAQEASFIVAQSQGFNGAQIAGMGNDLGNNVFEFSYLSGEVVHLQGTAGHALNSTQETYLINFLENCNGSSTAIEARKQLDFHISPNPSASVITISGDILQPLPYELLSIHGQSLKKGTLSATDRQIDLSALPANVYFLQIANQNRKIIKSP
ncbi:MAG: T9SS type A sorting domain-containing protein [Bacteroidota bacterium]